MKTITIGKKEYKIIESIFDINDERFTVFKQYLLQVFENLDKPSFVATFQKYVTLSNAGQHAEGLIEWYNFKKAVELQEVNYDAYSFCFALLCLEEGENQRDTSKATHLKKLEEMRSEGLNRGMVEDTVTDFMKASPKQFGAYLEMLEYLQMKPRLSEEI